MSVERTIEERLTRLEKLAGIIGETVFESKIGVFEEEDWDFLYEALKELKNERRMEDDPPAPGMG